VRKTQKTLGPRHSKLYILAFWDSHRHGSNKLNYSCCRSIHHRSAQN